MAEGVEKPTLEWVRIPGDETVTIADNSRDKARGEKGERGKKGGRRRGSDCRTKKVDRGKEPSLQNRIRLREDGEFSQKSCYPRLRVKSPVYTRRNREVVVTNKK